MTSSTDNLIQRIQNYVKGKLREHQNQITSLVDYKTRNLSQKISELEHTITQQNAQISQMQASIESARTQNARLNRLENQITDLELWKKGAIAQINTLISLQYERLEEVTGQWETSNAKTQALANQVNYIKQLARPRQPWIDSTRPAPILDAHAEELPPSGAGQPYSLP